MIQGMRRVSWLPPSLVSQRTKSQLQRIVEGIPLSAAQIYKDHCKVQRVLDKGQQRVISKIRWSNNPLETDYLVALTHFTPALRCWVTLTSLGQSNGVWNEGCGVLRRAPGRSTGMGEPTNHGGLNLNLKCWCGKSKLCRSDPGTNNNNNNAQYFDDQGGKFFWIQTIFFSCLSYCFRYWPFS